MGKNIISLFALKSHDTLQFPTNLNGINYFTENESQMEQKKTNQKCICCDEPIENKIKKEENSQENESGEENEEILNLEQVYNNKINFPKTLKTNLNILKPLHKVLYYFMTNQEISESHYSKLNEPCKQLISIYLQKKKYLNYDDTSLENLNKLRKEIPEKRSEEYVKFIFKKIIKFLKNTFKEYVYSPSQNFKFKNKKKSKYLDFEYSFHNYYYGMICRKMNFQIEKFFHPRKNSSVLNKMLDSSKLSLVEKSVSRIYICYMKMSEKFIKHMNFYLDRIIIKESMNLVKIRLHERILSWENSIEKKGFGPFINQLKNKFETNNRSKLCWSIPEIESSVKTFKKNVDETL